MSGSVTIFDIGAVLDSNGCLPDKCELQRLVSGWMENLSSYAEMTQIHPVLVFNRFVSAQSGFNIDGALSESSFLDSKFKGSEHINKPVPDGHVAAVLEMLFYAFVLLSCEDGLPLGEEAWRLQEAGQWDMIAAYAEQYASEDGPVETVDTFRFMLEKYEISCRQG